MKNTFLTPSITIILLFLLNTNIYAQVWDDIEYKKGDFEISAGVGLLSTFVGKNTKTDIPPLSITMNYRLQKNISIGTYVGYSRTSYVHPPTKSDIDVPDPSLTNDFFLVGVRGEGHFTRGQFDFYGGGMLGYNFSHVESENLIDGRLENIEVAEFSDSFTWSGYIGIKYLLTKHLGVFGEVGYSASLINLGITTRF